MRLLDRFGHYPALRDAKCGAIPTEGVLGPGFRDYRECFLPLGPRYLRIDLEGTELGFGNRTSASKVHAPIGQNIQGRDSLCNSQGMIDAKRKQHDPVSEADVFGLRRQMRQDEFGCGAV